jgi:hypothetical protein
MRLAFLLSTVLALGCTSAREIQEAEPPAPPSTAVERLAWALETGRPSMAIHHKLQWALEKEIGLTRDDLFRIDRLANQCWTGAEGGSMAGGEMTEHVVPEGEAKTRASIARQRNALLAFLLRSGEHEAFFRFLRSGETEDG